MQDSRAILKRWRSLFDCAYERRAYAVAVHPQIIGQAHHIVFFRLIHRPKDGVWFCAEIFDAWWTTTRTGAS